MRTEALDQKKQIISKGLEDAGGFGWLHHRKDRFLFLAQVAIREFFAQCIEQVLMMPLQIGQELLDGVNKDANAA